MADNSPEASTLDTSDALQRSNTLKAKGNDHFHACEWHQAISVYESALRELPVRIEKKTPIVNQQSPPGDEDLAEGLPSGEANKSFVEPSGTATTDGPSSQGEVEEHVKARAILNANIAACHIKLNDHKRAVDACSQALLDDPIYVKALQRRASANDSINSWTSLSAAQEDYAALLKLLPPSSSQAHDVERSLSRLKPRLEAAQKQETAEMFGKLKELGNSILGNFGLSTDNFKFEPNGQGGYSVNFSR